LTTPENADSGDSGGSGAFKTLIFKSTKKKFTNADDFKKKRHYRHYRHYFILSFYY
jgi:hypothetical protein